MGRVSHSPCFINLHCKIRNLFYFSFTSMVYFGVLRLQNTGHLMSVNLSLLPPAEKNKIELDKQASYFVWQLKQAKAGPELLFNEAEKIRDPNERTFFEQAIQKYKRIMGVA